MKSRTLYVRDTHEPKLVAMVNSRELICTIKMTTSSSLKRKLDDTERIAPELGELESCCYSNFIQDNQNLIPITKEIFDDLFCNPLCAPWSEGNGVVKTANSSYGNPIKINIHRPSYIRQNYGLDSSDAVSINKESCFRSCYGTGGGLKTLGIPKRQALCLKYFYFGCV